MLRKDQSKENYCYKFDAISRQKISDGELPNYLTPSSDRILLPFTFILYESKIDIEVSSLKNGK